MDAEAFSELVDDFTRRFPPPLPVNAEPTTSGRQGRLMLQRQSPAIVAYAVGYAAIPPLERFLSIIDTRSVDDALQWDVRQQQFWVKNNIRLLPFEEATIFLERSEARGGLGREFETWTAWRDLVSLFDWETVSVWGPGRLPLGQPWRIERLQLLYVVTESVARAEGNVMAQAFLLGRNPLLGAAPLMLISSSGREEAGDVLVALEDLFASRYGRRIEAS